MPTIPFTKQIYSDEIGRGVTPGSGSSGTSVLAFIPLGSHQPSQPFAFWAFASSLAMLFGAAFGFGGGAAAALVAADAPCTSPRETRSFSTYSRVFY